MIQYLCLSLWGRGEKISSYLVTKKQQEYGHHLVLGSYTLDHLSYRNMIHDPLLFYNGRLFEETTLNPQKIDHKHWS